MENKVNYIYAINFMNQFHTPRDQEAKNIRQNLLKWGVTTLSNSFSQLRSFILSQNVFHALSLDQL